MFIIPFVPGIFNVSLVWKDKTCKEGYYNINWNTSDIKVLKCEGMTSNTNTYMKEFFLDELKSNIHLLN